MRLIDADRAYRDRQPLVPANKGAEWAPRSYWQASHGVDFAAPVAQGEDVQVFINEGRWIAECPICHGAQIACETDKRFMCHCCGNSAINGRWRRTLWPPDTDAIESALVKRAHDKNRNWRPGESVADLEAETEAHERNA